MKSNSKTKKIIQLIIISVIAIDMFLSIRLSSSYTVDDISSKPNFTGVVEQVGEGSILVAVNEDEEEFKSSDKISVAIQAEYADSETQFEVGDVVIVYYSGQLMESYPAQTGSVYGIYFKK